MFATKTRLMAATAALAGVMFAGTAHAGHVSWSIGIEAPIGPGATIGTVISNRHVAPVVPAPVVYAPAPVVYAPAPVVYTPPPVVYTPPPVVYRPAPVVYEQPPVVYAPAPVYVPRRVVISPVWVGGRWVHAEPRRHHHHHRHHRDGWRDGRGHWDDDDRRGPPVHQPQGGWRRDR